MPRITVTTTIPSSTTYSDTVDFGPDQGDPQYPNLINEGVIDVNAGSATAVGVNAFQGYTVYTFSTIDNRGTIRAVSTTNAFGYLSFGWNPDLINSGDIIADGGAIASAVEINDATSLITNTGNIEAVAHTGSAHGINLTGGGTVNNSNLIQADGKTESIGISSNQWIFHLTNTGQITALQNTTDPTKSYGLLYFAGTYASDPATIINYGVISGYYSICESDGTNAPQCSHVENYGDLIGNVRLSIGEDVLINAHNIFGSGDLGRQDDLYDGHLGTITGTLFGADGRDTMIGGDSVDHFSGGGADDAITGGAGADTLDGGANNDVIAGDAGDDSLSGGTGFDWVDYSAAPSGVVVNLSGAASGGDGADTLSGFEAARGSAYADLLIAGPTYTQSRPEILKPESLQIDRRATAVSLDQSFGLSINAEVPYSDILPHSTVQAQAFGLNEYYSFTVTTAGSSVQFDIDHTYGADLTLTLLGSGGGNLAQATTTNLPSDLGSTTGLDPFLSYMFSTPGAYYIMVTGALHGDSYTLYTSLANAPTAPSHTYGSTLDGGGGDDILQGSVGIDTMYGGADNDTLDGGADADTMVGGTGDDVYYVDNVSDVITENSSEGLDAALISVSGYTLGANVEVAALQGGGGLVLTGNSLSNILYGAGGADTLNGGDGDDTMQGGAGADTMNGGLGNDTFYVAQAGDTVGEAAGQGTDATIVQMTAAYTLADNVEIASTFLGAGVNITGNGLDNQLYGNAGADTLNGAGGNDFMQGAGGNDAMIGGTGNDTYFIEDAGDTITENSNEGSDAVIVFTSSYTLTANVEVGARFLTTAYALTGNALDNQLYGNNGDDTLNGGDGNDTIQGGAGNDTMIGGLGNDTFFVEQAGDFVTENSNEGTDAVLVLIGSYTLAANVEVGAAFLTTGVALTGNGLDNHLYGNSGADTLSGAAGADLLDGGAGADTLTGGTENDVFMFVAGQSNGDTVTDFAGNGASAGDQLQFAGYGTAAGGATFVQLDGTHWQINSADGLVHDTITLANGAGVDASDWMFV